MERWGQSWREQESRQDRGKQQHRWRLLFAIASSLLLHFLVLMLVRQFVFQQESGPPFAIDAPDYMEVSFHTRPSSANESQFPEGSRVSLVGQENAALLEPANRQEAKVEDVNALDSSSVAGNAPARVTEAETEEDSNAEGADDGFDRQRLQESIDEVLVTYRHQQNENWLRECLRKRNARWRYDCNEDTDFQDSPIADEKAKAEQVFAVVLRDQQQRNVTLERERENSALSEIIERQDSSLVEALARSKRNLNQEVIAYLNGNFNDNYWSFLQNAFSHDLELGFFRSLAEPKCWDGPCIFEYTPPQKPERDEEKVPGFNIAPPLFPAN